MKKKTLQRMLCTVMTAAMFMSGCAGSAREQKDTTSASDKTEEADSAGKEATTQKEASDEGNSNGTGKGDDAEKGDGAEKEDGSQKTDSAEQGKIEEDPKTYVLNVNAANEVHEISDLLYGIFIEDINFAADGGLYAEMVQNRSFEFGKLAAGDELHAWRNVGEVNVKVVTDDTKGCLNLNNPNYAVIENTTGAQAGIENKGFLDGMAINENAVYNFSIYAKGLDGYTGPVYVTLKAGDKEAATAKIDAISGDWAKYELSLTSQITANSNVRLAVTIEDGNAAIDMVSLFPEDTYKGRKNGLRRDLAEKLEALNPSFLRFPGGCVVEGMSLDLAYDWKDSIGIDENGDPLYFNDTYGDVAARKLGQNIWTNENTSNDQNPCYMTYGLGFFEYFQLAEDIGAIGVPVVNCGLCCMGQSHGRGAAVGTEGMDKYIQDALDLVEFCRGDENTTWGKVRIALGHEAPFELKYIGIGNEQWGDDFFKHYEAFVDAFAKAREEKPEMYGDIEIMFTSGPDDGDSGHAMYMDAYEEAADWLKENPDKSMKDFAGAIDHHYYNTPDWFLSHNDYYDEENYSRSTENMLDKTYGGGINVFLGEYAAQSNTLRAALAEASYMTGLERNGDVIVMAAYAPLFGNLVGLHWSPDLIWFNNTLSTASINYYVQQIFGQNAGTKLLESSMDGAAIESTGVSGKIGVGTWSTSAEFSNIKITDNDTGEVIAEPDLSSEDAFKGEWEFVSDGKWSVEGNVIKQSSSKTDTYRYGTTGTAAYFGDKNWRNYTLTLTAKKNAGLEGFLIPFAVTGAEDNYFWNIGGWNNTVSCLQQVSAGAKSDRIGGTVKNCSIETGEEYELKVVVKDTNVKCYIDDRLYIDYEIPPTTKYECYQVVSTDESGDIIIKLVNVTKNAHDVEINIDGALAEDGGSLLSDKAVVYQVAGDSPDNDNILGATEDVTLESFEIDGVSDHFTYTVPMYSVTVIRIPRNK